MAKNEIEQSQTQAAAAVVPQPPVAREVGSVVPEDHEAPLSEVRADGGVAYFTTAASTVPLERERGV